MSTTKRVVVYDPHKQITKKKKRENKIKSKNKYKSNNKIFYLRWHLKRTQINCATFIDTLLTHL